MRSPSEPASRPPARRRRLASSLVVVIGLVVLAVALLRACAPTAAVHAIAVGDMACSPSDPKFAGGEGTDGQCVAQVVSDAAVARKPELLLGLGDYQYEVASAADYAAAYAPSWGRLTPITRPAIGNQELKVNKASTYLGYFGEQAAPLPGYYSYDVGDWHMVVLNTNCTVVEGGCGPESPQRAWLAQDLADNAGRCILAYGHHPRWSNGIAGPDNLIDSLYKTMFEGKVSLYLSGHESDYERFAPLNNRHEPDPQGVRQFVVGTGGQSLYDPAVGDAGWRDTFDPIPAEFFDATHNGFLDLTLGDGTYGWSFVTDTGAVTDSGTATCNGVS